MKNKKGFLIVLLILFTNFNLVKGQEKYPFTDISSENNILAYWYNCPPDSIYWMHMDDYSYLKSYIQVYGKIPKDSCSINVSVFSTDIEKIFEKSYSINESIKSDSLSIEFNETFFRITEAVNYHPVNPIKILVEIKSENKIQSKIINCKYHKLYGQITDFEGNPKKGFILVRPDAFELNYGFWSNENGYYEILLPERTYNNFYVNDGFYKVSNLETWSWHMIVNTEQRLDFKIGTGEIYNMNAWINNGGSSSYFISFRPMVLFPGENNYKKEINNKDYEIIDMFPELEISDLKVIINGNETEIYSLQKFYETGKDYALPSYILQVRKNKPRIGKQTIQLEFIKEIKIDGKKYIQSAQGYFTFQLNYSGLSKYY